MFCAGSKAAQIDNLSGVAQTLDIGQAGAYQPHVLAVGEVYRVQGKIEVHYQGRDIHIEDDEEYAIWKDGSFVIQKHKTHSSGLMQ